MEQTSTTTEPLAAAPHLSDEDMEQIHRIAHQLRRHTCHQVSFDELVAWGVTGMLEAKQRYVAGGTASFATYAHYRVRGAMLDGIGRIAPLPRAGYRYMSKGKRARRLYSIALDAEVIPDQRERMSPAALAEHRQLEERLRDAIDALPECQKHVLRRYYWEGAQLQDAAAELGKSKFWASRNHSQALRHLRKHMQAA